MVTLARTPVKISVESDDQTEVAVYKVGKLGRFTLKELNLRPGTYTFLGTRNGYKDILRKIEVKAGEKEMRVTMICREKI